MCYWPLNFQNCSTIKKSLQGEKTPYRNSKGCLWVPWCAECGSQKTKKLALLSYSLGNSQGCLWVPRRAQCGSVWSHKNFFIHKTCNNPKIIQLTVSASIDLRRSIKKLGFYGEILLNKMLSNWQILLNKVLAWWFNQEWRFNGADTVFGITCPKVNIVLSAPRSWRKVCAIYNLHKSWYTLRKLRIVQSNLIYFYQSNMCKLFRVWGIVG